MFGLDARIALAIFGALSVISGAALYSAIEGAKITAFHANLTEIEKALEVYYLDVGFYDKSSNIFNLTILLENTNLDNGWNGSYMSNIKVARPKELVLNSSLGTMSMLSRAGNDTSQWVR